MTTTSRNQAHLDHADAVLVAREQMAQIRCHVSGFVPAEAVESRLGVIEMRLREMEGAMADEGKAADRAHGLGMGEGEDE